MLKRRAALLAGASLLGGAPAWADTWPSKPIRLVIPFAPAGPADVLARVVAQKLGPSLGQTVLPDNRAGANGIVGTDVVAKAAPDGYTLLQVVTPHAINASLYSNLGFDFMRDIAPVIYSARLAYLVVVNPSVPAKTLPEFIAYAKANPGKLDYASTGNGSASHLAGELMDDMARISTQHVPYKGGAPALQDLLGGRVAMYYSTLNTAQPHIQAGKLIPLASTGPKRLPQLPQIPTIAESGYPGYSATNWYAFVASSKVPTAVLDRWNTELVKVLKNPDVINELNAHGMPPQPGTREDLAKEIARESVTWGRVIRDRKITLQ